MPWLGELADQRADLARLLRAERRRGLVHDQHAGVEVDRPRDRDRLALAARERAHQRVAATAGAASCAPSVALAACSIASSSRKPSRPRDLAAQEEVGDGVQILGQRQVLVDRLDAERLGVARRADLDRLAGDQDLAAVGG